MYHFLVSEEVALSCSVWQVGGCMEGRTEGRPYKRGADVLIHSQGTEPAPGVRFLLFFLALGLP